MNLIRAFRAMGAAFALVLIGFVSHAAVSPYWQSRTPGVTGAWLGDDTFNLNALWVAQGRDAGRGYTSGISASQTSAQANCTVLNQDAMFEVKTSASTGYVCLPTAVAGKRVMIGNASGQTIDIYSNATSYTSGTADTINGTAGTTAYTGLTSGKSTICFAANNGAWYCGSIS